MVRAQFHLATFYKMNRTISSFISLLSCCSLLSGTIWDRSSALYISCSFWFTRSCTELMPCFLTCSLAMSNMDSGKSWELVELWFCCSFNCCALRCWSRSCCYKICAFTGRITFKLRRGDFKVGYNFILLGSTAPMLGLALDLDELS